MVVIITPSDAYDYNRKQRDYSATVKARRAKERVDLRARGAAPQPPPPPPPTDIKLLPQPPPPPPPTDIKLFLPVPVFALESPREFGARVPDVELFLHKPVPDTYHFRIDFPRTEDPALGVGIKAEFTFRGLLVHDVRPNSAVDQWNGQCAQCYPKHMVKKGDLIVRVNGFGTLSESEAKRQANEVRMKRHHVDDVYHESFAHIMATTKNFAA